MDAIEGKRPNKNPTTSGHQPRKDFFFHKRKKKSTN